MANQSVTSRDRRRAMECQKAGLKAYRKWDVDEAVKELNTAVDLDPDNSDYRLNLAQALARSGDYNQALRVLGDYMRLEPDSHLTQRFEQLFASGMDEVEKAVSYTHLTLPTN